MIVAAKVEPILGSWRFAPFPAASPTATVRFQFKASFVRLPEAGLFYRKPIVPPMLFPTVDKDVFYPFRRPDSS